ncbi:MAG: glucose-1-phosphate adenylyltransferase subunit GlgD [Clostridia bacterium]|nr:glucose-1-phosphate adenylyltransferase subunit GlgD [Clostridia bacterium]
MNAAGLVFSNIHDRTIPEMTRIRTMASIPFGCRYRLIDFALSNLVNSNVTSVGVITHYNYQSLMDHIGGGKDWDLARRSGGIKILPPYVAAYENAGAAKLYNSRLEALFGAQNFINRCNADYIVLSDCDTVLNIDLSAVMDDHIRSGAYLTLVTKRMAVADRKFTRECDVAVLDENDRITEISRYLPTEGEVDVSTNIMVIRRTDLQAAIAEALARGYNSFHRDIIGRNLEKKLFRAYRFNGWYSQIDSLESYFSTSMELLTPEARQGLFGDEQREIYTKIRNSAPTKYSELATVSNSLVADGCVIEGKVENSILFRGVHVGRGAVVRNSVLLQDTFVGNDVNLHCVITDKNVVIRDGRVLSGHETMPFFIGKGITV